MARCRINIYICMLIINQYEMKLRKKIGLLFLFLLTMFAMTSTSCVREIFDRHFEAVYWIQSDLSNASDALVIEYENMEMDTTFVFALKQRSGKIFRANAYFYGNINEDYFPDGFIENDLSSYMTIYRYKGHEIQYLPRKYYDEKEDFVIRINQFFSDIEFIHSLYVTESMFEE